MSRPTPFPDADGAGPEPPPDDILAGEYVLGVLDLAQRQELRQRIERDAAFAAQVAAWEDRLSSWALESPAVRAPAALWPRIRAELGWRSERRRLWHNLALWRGLAAAMTAVAIALFLALRLYQIRPPISPSGAPVTTLAHADGTPGWLATVDVARARLLLVPVPAPPDVRGRVPELWLIPPGKAPRPLGLLSSARSNAVSVPIALRSELAAGSVLAVSLEPPGGAPGGAPTGPVIAKGEIRF